MGIGLGLGLGLGLGYSPSSAVKCAPSFSLAGKSSRSIHEVTYGFQPRFSGAR